VTKQGERKEDAQFHRIVAWNKLAELCAQLLSKGRRIYVDGRIQYRDFTDNENNKKQIAEIVIDDMIILDNKGTNAGEHPVEFSEGTDTAPTTENEMEPGDLGEIIIPDEETAVEPTATEPTESTDNKEEKKEDEIPF
jgi:single-strand DNA-binding protein